MKHVSIISGGTGSLQIQSALHQLKVPYKVIINAYDNGLSTGDVRKVYDGKILGPSDLRKNQLHIAALNNSVSTQLLKFLETRITVFSSQEFVTRSAALMDEYGLTDEQGIFLLKWIGRFIQNCPDDKYFDDYSIANAVYAAIAADNNYKLSEAGKVMANFLNIPVDAVLLTSDDSLFLVATTEKGELLLDEADIVEHKNPEDPIKNISLLDIDCKKVTPHLSPEVIKALDESSAIIVSTGTFWSSLAPTFIHADFQRTLASLDKIPKYYFYNVENDKDMYGVSLPRYIEILEYHIPEASNIFTFIIPNNIVRENVDWLAPKAFVVNPLAKTYSIDTSDRVGKKHSVNSLVDFFAGQIPAVTNTLYMFDLDDTLISRSSDEESTIASLSNLEIIDRLLSYKVKIAVVTGNSVNRLVEFQKKNNAAFMNKLDVYASGGGQHYSVDLHAAKANKIDKILPEKFRISQTDIELILKSAGKIGIPFTKISNRDGFIISIKPILKDREDLVLKLNEEFRSGDSDTALVAVKSGKTTIDVYRKNYNKAVCIQPIIDNNTFILDHLYVGDEINKEDGNDHCVKKAGYNCMGVLDIFETNIFLKSLLNRFEKG